MQGTGLTVRVTGASNTVYRLQRSSDLKVWLPVSENITPGSGITEWATEAGGTPVGFFRTD